LHFQANLYTAIFIASASVINPLVVVCGIAKYRRFVLAKLTFGFLSNSKPQATKVIRVSPTSNGLTVGGLGTMTATNQQQEQKPAAVSA
jgi:hypothetical protein